MLGKLTLLGAITGFVVASTLVPLETQAGGREWNGQGYGRHDGQHAPRSTVITQPTHHVHMRSNHWHHGHHQPGVVYAAPVQPVWVPAGWHWTGYQWVLGSGYWR